ncbi:sigma-54-dependent Fis family transcriptional regulator [Shewanella sp. Scap07]|uniref:sigma-54-dependent transcriptional regulator n=1 Tax=Shewanella sp. Scap07 TaxID=2589987 RepID=UPI0015BFEAE0|nr:response regulator [Shewanella sp. Scap07]QLE84028.1 sigma-54-dependent Fis family transcriptional regulator [Shewanella sp. Scap07]
MKLYRSILVVDDETRWLRTMTMTLKQEVPEAKIFCCENSRQAVDTILQYEIDLVLLDLNMPFIDGETLLGQIRAQSPYTRVIIVTGVNETTTAVNCVKAGAYDYYVKGGQVDHLIASVRRALEIASLEITHRQLKDSLLSTGPSHCFDKIFSLNPTVLASINYLSALSSTPYPIVVEGECGTGKKTLLECYAEHLDVTESTVFLSLKNMTEQQVSRLLYGQVRGARTLGEPAEIGTFEQCQNGLVILEGVLENEASWLEPLLDVLMRRQYYRVGSNRPTALNCRVVLLTQLPLTVAWQQQRISLAHFSVLQTHHLVLPPLRQRKEDIGLLASECLERIATSMNLTFPPLSFEVINQLTSLPWPGNVTQLQARIYQAVIKGTNGQLCLDTLLEEVASDQATMRPSHQVTFSESLPTLSEVQQLLIHEALRRADYNQTVAANMLGISQGALSRRLKSSV